MQRGSSAVSRSRRPKGPNTAIFEAWVDRIRRGPTILPESQHHEEVAAELAFTSYVTENLPFADPADIVELPPASPPPQPRRRLRTMLNRPFAAPGVSVAPAARSSMRFTERTALSDAERWVPNRWPEVIVTVAGLVIGIWMILSF